MSLDRLDDLTYFLVKINDWQIKELENKWQVGGQKGQYLEICRWDKSRPNFEGLSRGIDRTARNSTRNKD